MSEQKPIPKPATDEEISLMWPIYQADTAADGMVRMLFKRIESDAAKIKALELKRDTIQEYADQVVANLTAAEGTIKERDEQIARLEAKIKKRPTHVCDPWRCDCA